MTDKDEPMRDINDTEIDDRLQASRGRYIAEHDAHHDFEGSWAEIVALAEEPATPTFVHPMRRRGRRRILAGAGSIAAAAAIVAAIVVTDGSDAQAELAPRIVTATRSALADAIEYEVTDWENTPQSVDDEAWRDQTTAAVRFRHHAEDGSGVSSDMGPLHAPTPQDTGPGRAFTELYVDYCFGEYEISESPIPEDAVDITASVAAGVAMQLDDGSFITDGTEVVDGRELIRVVGARGDDSYVIYVDPDTYRPILIVDPEEGYRTTIEYLPRTPANLAAFTPTIPEGLQEVDELTRTNDHRPPCS